jgi:hypothetical protein
VNFVRGMRFVQLSALVHQQDGFCRMIPLISNKRPYRFDAPAAPPWSNTNSISSFSSRYH